MSGWAIEARGVRKRYGAVQAVAGVDLEVPAGSCFGLVGANGAGKTTFIKLLLGIARADDGEVRVLGGLPEDVPVRRQVGYLPERLAIPESFSAVRFLESVGRLRGLGRRALDVEVPALLERVGLDRSAWRRRSKGYSKGMRQRTGLAAALLGRPRLLVLDEPTDGIDPIGRADLREVIRDACRDGCTVFLNSHLLAESEKICDHVAVLSRGRVVKAGRLDVLRRNEVVRATFLRRDGAGDERAVAARHGFQHLEDRDDRIVFRLEGRSAEAVSGAVQAALADGLVLVELSAELKDLETILRESVAGSAGASEGLVSNASTETVRPS